MAEYIDRKRLKNEAKTMLRGAQVSPRAFFALYLGIFALLDLAAVLASGDSDLLTIFSNPLGLFVTVLVNLVSAILGIGVYLYCFGVRRGERMEFLTLFDGFSFAGKIILLYLAEMLFILLWSCVFVVPGFIAVYRYRFARLNLCENPSMGVMEAINMSKRQTFGYKGQLFALDVSYLGWMLLANAAACYFQTVYELNYLNGTALPGLELAAWAQVLIQDAVALAAGIFYLPAYQTTFLGYFETAKRTSGTGFGIVPDQGTDAF